VDDGQIDYAETDGISVPSVSCIGSRDGNVQWPFHSKRGSSFTQNLAMIQESAFSYCPSVDLDISLRIKIDSPIRHFMVIQVIQYKTEICRNKVIDNQWSEFDVKYSELTLNTMLRFIIYQKSGRHPTPFKEGMLDLFTNKK
jgi:hypothetical protein